MFDEVVPDVGEDADPEVFTMVGVEVSVEGFSESSVASRVLFEEFSEPSEAF